MLLLPWLGVELPERWALWPKRHADDGGSSLRHPVRAGLS
ncbi:hypothetical protein DVDV_1802 [Desulfovibrio sp. DV]|nr:hypothetical protein DVDV_1802 [Desulfovibrio sp. DV]